MPAKSQKSWSQREEAREREREAREEVTAFAQSKANAHGVKPSGQVLTELASLLQHFESQLGQSIQIS